MPEDHSALPVHTASDAAFDAIHDAVMETERGRWFLQEYARRNRSADTQLLLAAIERLETAIGARLPPAGTSLDRLTDALAGVRTKLAALTGERGIDAFDAPATLLHAVNRRLLVAARAIDDIAWWMGADAVAAQRSEELAREQRKLLAAAADIESAQAACHDLAALLREIETTFARRPDAAESVPTHEPPAPAAEPMAEPAVETTIEAPAARPPDLFVPEPFDRGGDVPIEIAESFDVTARAPDAPAAPEPLPSPAQAYALAPPAARDDADMHDDMELLRDALVPAPAVAEPIVPLADAALKTATTQEIEAAAPAGIAAETAPRDAQAARPAAAEPDWLRALAPPLIGASAGAEELANDRPRAPGEPHAIAVDADLFDSDAAPQAREPEPSPAGPADFLFEPSSNDAAGRETPAQAAAAPRPAPPPERDPLAVIKALRDEERIALFS